MVGTGDVIARRYRLESLLGQGGMGAVWRATHLELGRPVALKLVLADEPTTQAMERFLREAKSAAAVRHRNVVDVIDFGRGEDGKPFLAMECLEGESLDARLKRSPAPSLDEIVEWIAGALAGLGAIHDAGIVHRDLKPPNVFLARDADGVVPKVLDFGIARPTAVEASALTHTMQTLGTPHYMSPEQVRSARTVDARSDVYAMGVILYQALSGRLPFDGPSATAVIAAIVTDDPQPLAELRPDLPAPVAEVVHRAMARDPKARFENARALREALLGAARGISPGTAASTSRPSLAVAPTEIDPRATPITPAPTPSAAPRRTSRRGFFAMLGVLSTVLVTGLAGTTVLFGGRSPETASVAVGSPVPASVAPSIPPGTMPGATIEAPAADGRPSIFEITGALPVTAGSVRLVDLALAWRALDPSLRDDVTFRRLGVEGSARLGVDGQDAWTPVGGRAALDALDALGVPMARVMWIAPDSYDPAADLRPRLLSSRLRANVRARPHEESPLLRTLPARAIVVGVVGELDAEVSAEPGTEHAWTRVVVAEGLEGWVASGLLDLGSGCVPAADAVGPARVILSRVRAGLGGRDTDVFTFFDPEGAGTIRIARTDATCRLEDVGVRTERRGAIADYFLTRVTGEGDSLLVVGTWAEAGGPPVDGTETWRAYALADLGTSVWEIELRSGQNLPSGRRDGIGGPITTGPGGLTGYWPLRVRADGTRTYYVWDGATLVPEPSLVNVTDTSGE